MSMSSDSIHENFIVKQIDYGDRKPVVRQDRIPTYDGEVCYVYLNGKKYDVINYSVFGVALSSPEPFDPDESTKGAQFFFEDFEIGIFNLRFIRQKQMESGQYYIAFAIIGESIKTQVIDLLRHTSTIIKNYKKMIASEKKVPYTFRCKVYEAKEWLLSLKQEVDDLEKLLDKSDRSQLELIENTVTQVIADHLNQIFTPIFLDTVLGFDVNDQESIRLCVKFFHRRMRSLIYEDPFTSRSYYKPLGYAGDYETMNLIYRNEAAGNSLFAKCLHYYWIKKPAAQAVRNRAEYLAEKIAETFESVPSERTAKFLTVASGPAFEVQRIISEVKKYNLRKAEFHFLDQDLNALKYAQRKMYEISSQEDTNFILEFHNLAIKNIIQDGLYSNSCDLIYTAGLFDYFSDRIAKMAGKCLYKAVKPGGRLIIGNFDNRNPAAWEMRIALDWDLIHRSAEDLHELFGDLGGTIEIENEEEQINLFCVISKPY
ncbi:regulatory protein [Candidatus Magnetomorum sp. HK-1]|nr:regulatory protein [Candidatus Magnetomorum sp. HK-1]